jgi:ornithine carbamoyltransferase
MMEHERSVVFEQAENRLHVQKALLLMLLRK